jgi:hypothetical protein
MRVLPAAIAVVGLLASRAATAEPETQAAPPKQKERTIELGARAGLALPFGAIEQGTRESDLTFGAVPLAIDGGAVLSRYLTLGALFAYAPTVPKLCGSASECISSVGHDLTLMVLHRFHPPPPNAIRWLRPDLEAGIGYVWSSRSLVDSGAESTRSARGPVLRLALSPTVRLSSRLELAVVFGASLSVSSQVSLDAPGITEARAPDGRGVHGLIDLGVRLGSWL